MKHKKIVTDIFLNTISNFLLISGIQFFVFPYFNNNFSTSYFGEITAIYGINSMILAFLGDSLNNVKIMYQDEEGVNFNRISIYIMSISIIAMFFLFSLYSKNFNIIEIILFSVATGLGAFRLYLGAFLRIRLDYKSLLINNIVIFLGYIIGFFLFFISGHWSFVFFIGEILGVGYLIKKTRFYCQSFKYDKKLVPILKDYINLSATYGINSLSNYLDRLLIIPILGSKSMAIFYASSVTAKLIIMLLGQINSVVLAYIMKSNSKLEKKKILKGQLIAFLVLGILFLPLNYGSKLVIYFLYPTYMEEASNITTLIIIGVLFYSISNFIKILILKYYDTNIQVYMQSSYTIIYILLAIYMSRRYGLLGFTIAYSFMSIINLLFYNIIIIFGKVRLERR